MIKVFQLTIAEDQLENRKSVAFDTYVSMQITPSQELIETIKAGKIEGVSYELVAMVDTDNLETAFRQTNSISEYWGDNLDVLEVGESHRSTSTGDLMEKDGEIFVVAMMGFEAVTDLDLA